MDPSENPDSQVQKPLKIEKLPILLRNYRAAVAAMQAAQSGERAAEGAVAEPRGNPAAQSAAEETMRPYQQAIIPILLFRLQAAIVQKDSLNIARQLLRLHELTGMPPTEFCPPELLQQAEAPAFEVTNDEIEPHCYIPWALCLYYGMGMQADQDRAIELISKAIAFAQAKEEGGKQRNYHIEAHDLAAARYLLCLAALKDAGDNITDAVRTAFNELPTDTVHRQLLAADYPDLVSQEGDVAGAESASAESTPVSVWTKENNLGLAQQFLKNNPDTTGRQLPPVVKHMAGAGLLLKEAVAICSPPPSLQQDANETSRPLRALLKEFMEVRSSVWPETAYQFPHQHSAVAFLAGLPEGYQKKEAKRPQHQSSPHVSPAVSRRSVNIEALLQTYAKHTLQFWAGVYPTRVWGNPAIGTISLFVPDEEVDQPPRFDWLNDVLDFSLKPGKERSDSEKERSDSEAQQTIRSVMVWLQGGQTDYIAQAKLDFFEYQMLLYSRQCEGDAWASDFLPAFKAFLEKPAYILGGVFSFHAGSKHPVLSLIEKLGQQIIHAPAKSVPERFEWLNRLMKAAIEKISEVVPDIGEKDKKHIRNEIGSARRKLTEDLLFQMHALINGDQLVLEAYQPALEAVNKEDLAHLPNCSRGLELYYEMKIWLFSSKWSRGLADEGRGGDVDANAVFKERQRELKALREEIEMLPEGTTLDQDVLEVWGSCLAEFEHFEVLPEPLEGGTEAEEAARAGRGEEEAATLDRPNASAAAASQAPPRDASVSPPPAARLPEFSMRELVAPSGGGDGLPEQHSTTGNLLPSNLI